MDVACVGGHVCGLGNGHLVMRYTFEIRNVEKNDMFDLKSAYIVNALFNVKLRHTCLSLFGWFTFVEVTSA